jgi:hypothetical protein
MCAIRWPDADGQQLSLLWLMEYGAKGATRTFALFEAVEAECR